MPITVRGAAQVVWKPAWTLVLESVDGLSLEADGEDHTLIATLTESATGNPIIGKLLRLNTSPRGEVGDRIQRHTDGAGQVRFTVSNTDGEDVDYRVLVPPKGTVEDTITITWGTTFARALMEFSPAAGPTEASGTLVTLRCYVAKCDSGGTPIGPGNGDPFVGSNARIVTDPTGRVADGVEMGLSGVDGYTPSHTFTEASAVGLVEYRGEAFGVPNSIGIVGGPGINWNL